jgi:hypothetical protein
MTKIGAEFFSPRVPRPAASRPWTPPHLPTVLYQGLYQAPEDPRAAQGPKRPGTVRGRPYNT